MKRKTKMKRQKKSTSKKAKQTTFQKLLQRLPQGRKAQLIVVALLFAAVGTYLLRFSGAQSLDTSTDANTVVIEYALPHRDLPQTANLQNPVLAPPFILYGDGLLVCGHPTPDPFAVNTKIDPLYNPTAMTSTKLNKQAMSDLINKVGDTGFLQLPEEIGGTFRVDASETTLQVNLSSGEHNVSYFAGATAPKAYTETVSILQKTCSTVTEPYVPANAVQRVRKVTSTYGEKAKVIDNPASAAIPNLAQAIDKANVASGDGDQDNDVPIHGLGEVNRTMSAGQVKSALNQLDGKTHGYIQAKGATYEVRIDQTLPTINNPVHEHGKKTAQKGLKDTVAQAVAPKASAQSVIPVRYVVLIGSDQQTSNTTTNIINRLNNLGPSVSNWYCKSVGRCYTYQGVSLVRGSQTQAYYNTCHDTTSNCSNSGNQLFAVLYNVSSVDPNIAATGYVTVVVPGWATNTLSAPTLACGVGFVNGGLSAVDMTTPDPNSSASLSCTHGANLGHEPGHNFGLNHTCNGTLMDGPPACVYAANCDIGEFSTILRTCGLDGSQAAALATKTQYFATPYSAPAPATAMRPGTSPAIYGSMAVYQDSAGSLHYYNFSTGKGGSYGLGMADKTSPSISGDNIMFQANTGNLYRKNLSTGNATNQGLGMAGGTSPAIDGSYVVFQANTTNLYFKNLSTGGVYNLNLGMMPGTSPAISGDKVVFQANTTTLYRKNLATGGVANQNLGMAGGTSPAIYGDNVAFQANTGSLWLRVLGGGTANYGLGMAGGTSPAIYGNNIMFQANTTHLFRKNISTGVVHDTGLGMMPGTSPAIYGSEVVFQANTGYLWHYNFSSGAASRLL